MIAVIDTSAAMDADLQSALARVAAPARFVRGVDDLANAAKIILASRADFGATIRHLRDADLVRPLIHAILDGTPILAVGVGACVLFDTAHLSEQHTGLGVIPGKVRPTRDDADGAAHRAVVWRRPWPLVEGLNSGTEFHFERPLLMEALDPSANVAISTATEPFAAAVWSGAIFGTLFEPQRSGPPGDRLLANFVEMQRDRAIES